MCDICGQSEKLSPRRSLLARLRPAARASFRMRKRRIERRSPWRRQYEAQAFRSEGVVLRFPRLFPSLRPMSQQRQTSEPRTWHCIRTPIRVYRVPNSPNVSTTDISVYYNARARRFCYSEIRRPGSNRIVEEVCNSCVQASGALSP